jgi:hypothetical protein
MTDLGPLSYRKVLIGTLIILITGAAFGAVLAQLIS